MISNTQVILHQDGLVPREALAGFLHAGWPETPVSIWLNRLQYWWDDNPFREADSHLGYTALAGQEIVGFGGYIPAKFAWQGQPVPGLYATSFRVDEKYSKVAAKMFLNQREVMERHVIVHSTPLPKIQTALVKMGGRGETQVTCHYIALGKLGYFNGQPPWPVLPRTMRVVTDLAEVSSLTRPYQRKDRLEKWTTLESLKWYCRSPMRRHHFIGAVDAAGVLSSFLLIAARRRRGIGTWDVVETFTTRDTHHEMLALLGALVHEPDLLPGRKRLLTVTDFGDDPALAEMPALIRRKEQVSHFFLLPKTLSAVPKHTVLAEGDLGL